MPFGKQLRVSPRGFALLWQNARLLYASRRFFCFTDTGVREAAFSLFVWISYNLYKQSSADHLIFAGEIANIHLALKISEC